MGDSSSSFRERSLREAVGSEHAVCESLQSLRVGLKDRLRTPRSLRVFVFCLLLSSRRPLVHTCVRPPPLFSHSRSLFQLAGVDGVTRMTTDQNNVRETGFAILRVGGGGAMCCCLTPGALISYFLAVAVFAHGRNLNYFDAMGEIVWVWVVGFMSGAVEDFIKLGAMFYFYVECKGEKFEKVKPIAGGANPV